MDIKVAKIAATWWSMHLDDVDEEKVKLFKEALTMTLASKSSTLYLKCKKEPCEELKEAADVAGIDYKHIQHDTGVLIAKDFIKDVSFENDYFNPQNDFIWITRKRALSEEAKRRRNAKSCRGCQSMKKYVKWEKSVADAFAKIARIAKNKRYVRKDVLTEM